MAYIYLKELKKILPDILDQWIDKDDESWGWIFQEIEQKCHVGKKSKKKKKVSKGETVTINPHMYNSEIDAIEIAIMAHRNDINECNRKITNLSDVYTGKVHQMQLTINDLRAEVMHLKSEITAAKSMAETAKQRTEVDYDQISKAKNDADVIQDVYNRMAGRGATREELNGFRNLIHKYDALEKKEIPISHCNPDDKDCKTCKYYCGEEAINEPCIACDAYQCWEASDGTKTD